MLPEVVVEVADSARDLVPELGMADELTGVSVEAAVLGVEDPGTQSLANITWATLLRLCAIGLAAYSIDDWYCAGAVLRMSAPFKASVPV